MRRFFSTALVLSVLVSCQSILSSNTDLTDVSQVKSTLAIGFSTDDSINSVTGNLSLPVSGSNGVSISWESNNPSVVTAAGTVTRPVFGNPDVSVSLTATIRKNSVFDTKVFTATVKALSTIPVVSVALDQSSLTLLVEGARATLTSQCSPANATNQAVSWTSSAPLVASVTGGIVVPLSVGSATITVTTQDGDKTATCAVTVNRNPNLYISGSYTNTDNVMVPCYWKNGTRTDLSVMDPSKNGRVFGIAGDNGDLYLCGYTTDSDSKIKPCYWKNGNRIELSTASGEATGITISGQDLYVTGAMYNTTSYGIDLYNGVYWKNGVVNNLDRSYESLIPKSIMVSNGDAYIACNEMQLSIWPILTFSDTVTCYGSEGEEWKYVGDTVTS